MKFLFTFILASFFLVSFAKDPGHLSIAAGRNDRMDLKCISKSKRSLNVVITVTDAAGKTISTQYSALVFGENTISLPETAGLPEGSYAVQMESGNKIYKTQFIVWK